MFSKLDDISPAGSAERANEDICGMDGDWAWVIDGFTPSPLPPAMSARSDAAWFSAFADARFRELTAQGLEGPEIVRRTALLAQQVFLAAAPERTDPAFWPGASLTLVKCSPGKLEIWRIGDTAAYVRTPDGNVATIGELEEMRRIEAGYARRLLTETGAKPGDILKTKQFRDWLEQHRRKQTDLAHVQVFGLQPEAGDALEHVTLDAATGTLVLLASDGFSALVELYGDRSVEELMEAVVCDGLGPLVQRIRVIETEMDPDGVLFPRFKGSDDATALFLRCV